MCSEQSMYDDGYRDGTNEANDIWTRSLDEVLLGDHTITPTYIADLLARIKALAVRGIERDEQGYRNAASDALLGILALDGIDAEST